MEHSSVYNGGGWGYYGGQVLAFVVWKTGIAQYFFLFVCIFKFLINRRLGE